MRNYAALNLARVYYADNQGNNFSRLVWGTDSDNLQTNIAWMTNQVSSPLQSIDNLHVNYVLLDKINLADLLTVLGSGFPFNTISPGALFYAKDPETDDQGPVASDNSPRSGWTDAKGTIREPPPSDGGPRPKQDTRGATSLVNNFITFMQNLVISLKARKEKIDALIVQQLLNQFLAGQVSITQILVELEKDFIIN